MGHYFWDIQYALYSHICELRLLPPFTYLYSVWIDLSPESGSGTAEKNGSGSGSDLYSICRKNIFIYKVGMKYKIYENVYKYTYI